MERLSRTFDALVPHAYDYAIGVWWLFGAVILFVSPADIARAVATADGFVAAGPHLRFPDYAVVALIGVLTVVVPYCVAMAALPLAMSQMNLILRLHRKFLRRRINLPAAAFGEGIAPSEVLMRGAVIYPRIARMLSRSQHHIQLQVGTFIPTAALVGTLVARAGQSHLIPAFATVLGVGAGCVVLIGLSISANRAFFVYQRQLEWLRHEVARRERERGFRRPFDGNPMPDQ